MRRSGRTIRSGLCVTLALLVACALGASGFQAWAQTPKADTAAPQSPKARLPQVRYDTDGLPRAVVELREAMLAAIEAGEIEELRHIFDLSEIKPDIGAPPKTDSIAHWKSVAGDTQGREVLAALSLILDTGYVAVRRGSDIENNQLYVWPYFAELPLSRLTSRQEVELLRLMPANVAREMKEKGKYTGWRLVIGADGTWHTFRKGE